MKRKSLFINHKSSILNRRKLRLVISIVLIFSVGGLVFLRFTGNAAKAAWFDDTYAYRLKFAFTHNADISTERAVTFTLDTAELIAANQ
jgi:hypothetical protein